MTSSYRLLMNQEQHHACLAAMHFTSCWLSGNIDAVVDLIEFGLLKKSKGEAISFEHWPDIQSALLDVNNMLTGRVEPVQWDVYDPLCPPHLRVCLQSEQVLQSMKPVMDPKSVYGLPSSWTIQRDAQSMFHVYSDLKRTILKASTESVVDVLNFCVLKGTWYEWCIPSEHVRFVLTTLDVYSRLLMGQWETLKDWRDYNTVGYGDEAERYFFNTRMAMFKRFLLNFDENESHGIYSPVVPSQSLQVWNVYKSLRHHSAMQSAPKFTGGVAFDEPYTDDFWPLGVYGSDAELLAQLPPQGQLSRWPDGFMCEMPDLNLGQAHVTVSQFVPTALLKTLRSQASALNPSLASDISF